MQAKGMCPSGQPQETQSDGMVPGDSQTGWPQEGPPGVAFCPQASECRQLSALTELLHPRTPQRGEGQRPGQGRVEDRPRTTRGHSGLGGTQCPTMSVQNLLSAVALG